MRKFPIFLAITLAGCAGHFERTISKHTANAIETAQNAGVYDLNCDDVSASVISRMGAEFQVGARGCDRTETYRMICNSAGCVIREHRIRTRQKHVIEDAD